MLTQEAHGVTLPESEHASPSELRQQGLIFLTESSPSEQNFNLLSFYSLVCFIPYDRLSFNKWITHFF